VTRREFAAIGLTALVPASALAVEAAEAAEADDGCRPDPPSPWHPDRPYDVESSGDNDFLYAAAHGELPQEQWDSLRAWVGCGVRVEVVSREAVIDILPPAAKSDPLVVRALPERLAHHTLRTPGEAALWSAACRRGYLSPLRAELIYEGLAESRPGPRDAKGLPTLLVRLPRHFHYFTECR
jgi:hypothetical protein